MLTSDGPPPRRIDESSAPMRPICGFSSCAARSRMSDALAALLVASATSGPPGSPNLSPLCRSGGPRLPMRDSRDRDAAVVHELVAVAAPTLRQLRRDPHAP